MKIKHTKERLFDCDECGYRSNWMQNITMHKNGEHEIKQLFRIFAYMNLLGEMNFKVSKNSPWHSSRI